MPKTVKHVSLHRVTGTELRVISDVERGVLPVVEVEIGVIERCAAVGLWRHKWVGFFVLEDLRSLRSALLERAEGTPDHAGLREELNIERAAVNIYDLADMTGCNVFVNVREMRRSGYWGDDRALRGLLAHEHAHPLSENAATRASRDLVADLSLQQQTVDDLGGDEAARAILAVIDAMIDTLCLTGPREVMTNETTILAGFGSDVMHLDALSIANARKSLSEGATGGRVGVHRGLQDRVARGDLSASLLEPLLLLGDMQSHLDQALEIAGFYRADRREDARDLRHILTRDVLSELGRGFEAILGDLVSLYIELDPDMTPEAMLKWSRQVAEILMAPLEEKGLSVACAIDWRV